MLHTIRLDDENFIEIFEKSRKMIPLVYPDWSDYNDHDPGITLLELLSWLKEMQQFYLDQIGKDNYLMYLKLLGVRRNRMTPAASRIEIRDSQGVRWLPAGMKFMAGDIVFETPDAETVEENRIIGCQSVCSEEKISYSEEMLNSGSIMKIPVFGTKPEAGNSFELYFEKPFSKDELHKIYFDIFSDYEITRNQFRSDFFPLAEIEMQYYTEKGYVKCEQYKDHTHGFLEDGEVVFYVRQDMYSVNGRYVLRFVLKKSEYDVIPILRKIRINIFKIYQIDTRSDYVDFVLDGEKEVHLKHYIACRGRIRVFKQHEGADSSYEEVTDYRVLNKIQPENLNQEKCSITLQFAGPLTGKIKIIFTDEKLNEIKGFETDGFPYQAYSLNDKDILYNGFEIMIRETLDQKYYIWKKVDNFNCSGPEDRHYVLDEEQGILLFGDCEKGMAPEGQVLFIKYIRSKGFLGNIKKNKINRISDVSFPVEVTNISDISNGRNKESIEQAFERFRREQNSVERAVTYQDFETIVLHTPGLMIRRVKVLTDKDAIAIIVQPYSYKERPKLGEAYYKNIIQNIDKKRMIGTRITVLSPEYYDASIFAEVSIHPHYIGAKEILNREIQEYFTSRLSGFGCTILYSEIFGMIDAMDCVSSVKALFISVNGRNVIQTKNEDIIIPKNGLVSLKEADYLITLAEY